MTWQMNTLGVTYGTVGDVNAAMTAAANGVADTILYNGHGNSVRLGDYERIILDTTLVQNWQGNVVFLQSTCTGNWMANNSADFKSIAIQAMTQAQGGISASVGTSTYMNPDVAVAFMDRLLKNTGSANARWGQALMQTQQWASAQGAGFYQDAAVTEQIFGDPAMPVYAPPARNTGGNSTGGTTNSGSTSAPVQQGTF